MAVVGVASLAYELFSPYAGDGVSQNEPKFAIQSPRKSESHPPSVLHHTEYSEIKLADDSFFVKRSFQTAAGLEIHIRIPDDATEDQVRESDTLVRLAHGDVERIATKFYVDREIKSLMVRRKSKSADFEWFERL